MISQMKIINTQGIKLEISEHINSNLLKNYENTDIISQFKTVLKNAGELSEEESSEEESSEEESSEEESSEEESSEETEENKNEQINGSYNGVAFKLNIHMFLYKKKENNQHFLCPLASTKQFDMYACQL